MHTTPLHSLVLRAAGFSKILSTGTSPMYHVTATVVVGSKSYQSGSDPLCRNILHITPQDSFLLRTKRIKKILSIETSPMFRVTVTIVFGSKSYK